MGKGCRILFFSVVLKLILFGNFKLQGIGSFIGR